MSLTCSDVRVSDRTEGSNAPRTAQVDAGVARRSRTSGIAGTKATMGYKQQKPLCFLNFKEKRFVGRLQLHREGDNWRRFRFKFDVPCPAKGRAEVLKANILPHLASGPTSPDDKQKSRLQVLRLFYHSSPSDGSRTESSATAAGTSTARPSAGTKMNLTKLRSQGTANHNRAAN